MEDPHPGDTWTYEISDEISGKVTDRRTDTITDVSPAEIAVRSSKGMEREKAGFNLYDRNWNAKTTDVMKFAPHSGLGVVQPLTVGATWNFKVDQTNTEKGFSWKWSGQSKVTGEEKLTTKAGTFDTFKIETNYTFFPVKNPGRKSEAVLQTWYAPAIDHWVLRKTVIRTEQMVRVNSKVELVSYGRKN